MAKPITIDVTNDFNEIGRGRLAEALERGDTVSVYVACIGHTRHEMVSRAYAAWLSERYGERLESVGSLIFPQYKLRF